MAGGGALSISGHPDEAAYSIRRRLEGLSPLSECCIFIVPKMLRQTNKEAYTPQVIAIGPYHRSNESLKLMEDHKLLYLQDFLWHNESLSLEHYTRTVKSWEDEVRQCYDKQIDLNSNQFTEMILLDGTFLIQLLLINSGQVSWPPNDRIFDKPWLLADVCRDMALLENQIPFFVVQRLFSMAFGTQQPKKLLELVCLFFETSTGMDKLPESVMESESKVKHLVDVIRLSFLQSETMPQNGTNLMEEQLPPRATDLVAAGVKLRRGESKYLLDIEFKKGVLKIPQLVLYDVTEYYIRNIIAFEQCYHECNRYLTDYMVFMDRLVDTSGDAKLLIDKGIIRHQLSNEEAVPELLNALGKEVTLSQPNYYFKSLSHELIKHCEKTHNKWKATFKRDYCSSPWVVISVIAAVVLLLLTVVQTVCSVLSFK